MSALNPILIEYHVVQRPNEKKKMVTYGLTLKINVEVEIRQRQYILHIKDLNTKSCQIISCFEKNYFSHYFKV